MNITNDGLQAKPNLYGDLIFEYKSNKFWPKLSDYQNDDILYAELDISKSNEVWVYNSYNGPTNHSFHELGYITKKGIIQVWNGYMNKSWSVDQLFYNYSSTKISNSYNFIYIIDYNTSEIFYQIKDKADVNKSING